MYSKIIALKTIIKKEIVSRKLKSGEYFGRLHNKYGKPFGIGYSTYKKEFLAANPAVKNLNNLRAGKTYNIPTYKTEAVEETVPVATSENRVLPAVDLFNSFKIRPANPLGLDFLDRIGILGLRGSMLWNIYKDSLRTTVPEAKDLPKAHYEIPGAKNLKGLGYGAKGPEVLKLQKILSILAAYGPRFQFDSYYGYNMMGAILFTKYLFINQFGLDAKKLAYGETNNLANMKRSAEINSAFIDRLEEVLYEEKVNGKKAFTLPAYSEVLFANKTNKELLEELTEEEKISFPVEYYNAILKHESGGSHFFKLDLSELKTDLDQDGKADKLMQLVTFGMDWQGWKTSKRNYTFSSRVSFYPKSLRKAKKEPNQQAPWKNSTGWGLTQFTTFSWRWPTEKVGYIYSKKENLRAGLKLFIQKYKIAKRALKAADKAKIKKLAGDNGLSTKDDNSYWLAAVWFYNGYSAAGFKYLTYIVKHYLA